MPETDRWFQPLGLSNPAAPRGSVLRLHGAEAPAEKGNAPQSRPQAGTASQPGLCRAKFEACQHTFEGFPQAAPPTGFMALMMDVQVRIAQWRTLIDQSVPGEPIFPIFAELLAQIDQLERLIQPVLPRHFRRAAEKRRAALQSMQPSDATSRRQELIPYPGAPLGDPSTVLTQQPVAQEAHACITDDQGEQTPPAKFSRVSRLRRPPIPL